MKIHKLLMLAVVVPVSAYGQATPGTNLSASVAPSMVTISGSKTHVEFRLINALTSHERLFVFTLDAPAPVTTIMKPNITSTWDTGTKYWGRSVAQWALLDDDLGQPGSATPTLSFEAVGLPTIVRSWTQGWAPVEFVDDSLGEFRVGDPLTTNSILGNEIGIEPYPVTNPANLLLRLITLQDRACGSLGWLKSLTFCQNLKVKLQHAQLMVVQRTTAAAKADIASYIDEISIEYTQQSTGRVTDKGYWLLVSNAKFIATLLP